MQISPKSARIALLIESSRGYGRNLLLGVAAFARTHGPWSIYRHERALGDAVPDWLQRWDGDGIIARIESEQLAEYLIKKGCPTVDLRARYTLPGIPSIVPNDLFVVRMAYESFIGRGIDHFGFCGFEGVDYSDSRRNFAIQYLAEHGVVPSVYETPHGLATDTTGVEAEGMFDEAELGQWLAALPRPVGVLACNDIRGGQVLNVCRANEIKVPDDVAVTGVDNDELICALTTPPLSSVAVDSYRAGYLAGELLSKMLAGETVSDERLLVEPVNVISRQSSDVFAIEDNDLVDALRFIRDNACDGINVEDVARAVQLSRSTLDRRFSRLTGTTAKGEITRVRVDRVKQLLVDTDYPLSAIASMTGFAHAEYMSTMFKEHTNETPGQYRHFYHGIRQGGVST